MTIEIRQLTIRSRVGGAEEPAGEDGPSDCGRGAPVDEGRVRQILQEVMSQCRRWVDRRLAEERDR